ncbi:MAG: Protein transport protein S9 plasma membrane t-SNARE, partial [Thelocarpon superellum]
MKKFGLSKKPSEGEGDDPNRSALFGARSSKKPSAAPSSSNPYAQGAAEADPYVQDQNKYAHIGRPVHDPSPSSRGGAPPSYGGYG